MSGESGEPGGGQRAGLVPHTCPERPQQAMLGVLQPWGQFLLSGCLASADSLGPARGLSEFHPGGHRGAEGEAGSESRPFPLQRWSIICLLLCNKSPPNVETVLTTISHHTALVFQVFKGQLRGLALPGVSRELVVEGQPGLHHLKA